MLELANQRVRGRTPLHVAALRGDPATVRALIRGFGGAVGVLDLDAPRCTHTMMRHGRHYQWRGNGVARRDMAWHSPPPGALDLDAPSRARAPGERDGRASEGRLAPPGLIPSEVGRCDG